MRKWLKKMSGLKGQTTAEYAIIVALVAVSSIAVILIFGDKIRGMFTSQAQLLNNETPTDSGSIDTSKTGGSIKPDKNF